MSPQTSATAEAPVNIALIKYWGKRDQSLNLPTNSSLSITLKSEPQVGTTSLHTRTTVRLVQGTDSFSLNGRPCELNQRLLRVLSYIRSLRSLGPVAIESANFFPTSAGLASSASAYAALATAVNALLDPPLSAQQMSIAARLGSGSACRSLFAGFVQWEMGCDADGSDSIATSLFDADHWETLSCVVVILSDQHKEISSANGMQRTAMTSSLYPARLKMIPFRIAELTCALCAKDFSRFAELVMRDSNQFHAVCLDAFPPIKYLTEQSHKVIQTIHALNCGPSGTIAGYTFDAGPNAFVFCERPDLDTIEAALRTGLPDCRMIRCSVGLGPKIVE